MTHNNIRWYSPLNPIEAEKVEGLVKSMLENGWQGCPILVVDGCLLTGSHRLAALEAICQMVEDGELEDAEVLHQDVAEDVSEIVTENYTAWEAEHDEAREIEYDNIGWLLAGSWVEEYKGEIEEW